MPESTTPIATTTKVATAKAKAAASGDGQTVTLAVPVTLADGTAWGPGVHTRLSADLAAALVAAAGTAVS